MANSLELNGLSKQSVILQGVSLTAIGDTTAQILLLSLFSEENQVIWNYLPC